MFRFATPVLVFIAFLLLLLCSVSTPINTSLYLFDLDATKSASFLGAGVQGKVRFGLWGYCTSGFKATVLGVSREEAAECTAAQRGFTIDNRLAQLLQINDLTSSVSQAVTLVLVIHPVACALAFLSFIAALFIAFRPSKVATLATLITTLLAALLALVCFLVDVIFVAVTRSKIADVSADFHVTYGNVVWMALGATIALWIATVTSCLSMFSHRRNNKERNVDEKF